MRRGKYKGQKSTFKLTNPIKTPIHPKDIHASNGGLLNRKGKQAVLRYAERVKGVNPSEGSDRLKIDTEQVKDTAEQVKDVYYNKRKREEKRGKRNKTISSPLKKGKTTTFPKEERELFREAKRELERLADEGRIFNWLCRLPRRFHGDLRSFLNRVYPQGHSYDEAKDRYETVERG